MAIYASCENSVNFGPLALEFTRVVGVHPFVDQQWNLFSYVRLAAPLLGMAVISTGFCGAVSFFHYNSLGGATLLCLAGYTLGFVTHF